MGMTQDVTVPPAGRVETADVLPRVLKLAVLLVPALAGLTVSALLFVDYVRPQPVFCDAGGGCGVVRETGLAYPFGVPMPAFGMLGFVACGALALAPGKLARFGLAVFAGLGAILAAFLLYTQHLLGTYCPFCVVADTSALVLFPLALVRLLAKWEPAHRVDLVAGMSALALAVAIPLVLGWLKHPLVPSVITAEDGRSSRGKVTVIDFVDFECPFCRMTHQSLEPLLERYGDKVRVVRRNVPLTHIHPHALDAARAACCGEALGKGDEMANGLFAMPVEELTPEGCERLARSLGLDAAKYEACVKSAATDASIESDSAMFKESGGHGLPTVWVDGLPIEGAQPAEVYAHAIESELARQGS
jgi:predicted DsbA family dithiol-disulfide isomerase/uncharacterized membrane protein